MCIGDWLACDRESSLGCLLTPWDLVGWASLPTESLDAGRPTDRKIDCRAPPDAELSLHIGALTRLRWTKY